MSNPHWPCSTHTHVTSGGFNYLFLQNCLSRISSLRSCLRSSAFSHQRNSAFFVQYHMYRQHESPDHVRAILFFSWLVGLIIWCKFQAHDSVVRDLQCSIIAGLLFHLTATAECIVPISLTYHWRMIGIATVIRLLSCVSAYQGQGCKVSLSRWGVIFCCDKVFCRVIFRVSLPSKEHRTPNHGGEINGNVDGWLTQVPHGSSVIKT